MNTEHRLVRRSKNYCLDDSYIPDWQQHYPDPMPELGVRRAYGATKWNILWQVLNENLVYTLIGGVIGLAFSYVAMFMLKDWLLMSSLGQAGITLGMFSWLVFAIAFFFCLLLNLLSAGIPA